MNRAAGNVEARSILVGCLLYVGGQSLFFVMPGYLAFLGGRFGLGTPQLGVLASAESIAFAMTSLVAPLWIHRVDRRIAIVGGVLVLALGTALTPFCARFDMLVAIRVIVGLLGEGVLGTLSFNVLGAAAQVDRAFAIALTVAASFGALALASASTLAHIAPAFGLLLPMIAIALTILPALSWIPMTPQGTMLRARTVSPSALTALAAQAIWFGAPGAFWSFAEQLATDKGLTNHVAELGLSAGQFFALFGSLAAAIAGNRLGRVVPIALSSFGIAASALAFQSSAGAVALAIFLSTFYAFWNYGAVYQMSFVTELDASGNANVVMPAVQVIGLSIGPLVAGELIALRGDIAAIAATLAFTVGGLGLYLVAHALRPRPVAQLQR